MLTFQIVASKPNAEENCAHEQLKQKISVKDIFYLPKDLNYKDIIAPSAIENIKFCQMISSTNL